MKTYKLNGSPVEIVSQRSMNNRRFCKAQKSDGSIEEVLYRELERGRDRRETVGDFTPKQWRLIREGKASQRMKEFWLRQNGAQALERVVPTGKLHQRRGR